jgi:RHS repeat-associated protein
LETKKALSLDAEWSAEDANQSSILQYFDPEDGFWGANFFEYTPEGLAAHGKRGLGGYAGVTEATTLGNWQCTGVEISLRGGEQTVNYSWRLPGTALTRTRRYADGALRLSVTSYNGLPLVYDTNGTTYSSKIASYSVLRDSLSYVDATSGYWPYRAVTAADGLTSYEYLPGGTLKYLYTWFAGTTGNDVRAGQLASRYTYASPAAYTYYDYNARGQRIRVWGGESPAQTTYDNLGRMKFLTTYRGGTWAAPTSAIVPWSISPGTADTTEWTYPPSTGLQLSKIYPDAGGQAAARRTVGYTYHPNGSLATRTWQRRPDNFSNTLAGAGVVTSYLYDAYTRLQIIDYPVASTAVAATPDVIFTYDPAGRISTRTEAAQATTTYLYKPWGAAWKETITSLASNLPSSVVERTYDGLNRPDLLKVTAGGTAAPDVDYNFHGTTGLLDNVVTDARTITYGYNGIGPTPTSLTYAHSGSTLLSTTRFITTTGPTAGLISTITHNQGATPFQSLNYTYSVDQDTSVTRGAEEDTMRWDYRYDARRQVTSADKKFSNGEFAAGLQTQYAYDMAGNRTSKSQGGSATTVEGTGVRNTTYTANALNQYPTVAHPNSAGTYWADVSGRRSSTNESIKVNNVLAAYQQTATGLHFRREVPLTAAALTNRYAYLYTTSTVGSTTTTVDAGYQYVPLNSPGPSEPLTYDADGNLLSDGRWVYTWDAENRLVGLVTYGFDPYQQGQAIGLTESRWTFKYDGLSRRVLSYKENFPEEANYDYDWALSRKKSYVYDGWNLVQEYTEDYYLEPNEDLVNTPVLSSTSRQNYVWGPDIGSPTHGHTSWQKAGGVGGLLYVNGNSGTYGKQFPLMDRLGNVTGYRRAVSGSPAALDAVYEYDAFGREVRSTGPASDLMPFRFSTKYTDAETGLVYYGYRFYDPDRGRWVNRDPIGEQGGYNLYGMVGNNPLTYLDANGLSIWNDITSFCKNADWKLFLLRLLAVLENSRGAADRPPPPPSPPQGRSAPPIPGRPPGGTPPPPPSPPPTTPPPTTPPPTTPPPTTPPPTSLPEDMPWYWKIPMIPLGFPLMFMGPEMNQFDQPRSFRDGYQGPMA